MKRFPHLVPGARFREEPDGRYLLEHPDGQRCLRMGQMEYLLLSALDGDTPPSELARNLGLALGRPISERSMAQVLGGLGAQGFVLQPRRLPVEHLPGARVRCCGSGHCCHLGVGPLTELEQQRLQALPWEEAGETPPEGDIFVEIQGQVFVRQRPADSACVFLEDDGRCRIHRVFSYDVKPAICRLYPVFAVELDDRLRAGVCFECPGTSQAAAEDSLGPELARAGELLATTRLEGLQPATSSPGEPEDDEEWAASVALEQALLAGLRAPGSHEALLAGLDLLRAQGRLAGDGVGLSAWAEGLRVVAQNHLDALRSPFYRARMEALLRRLAPLAAGLRPGPRSLSADEDALLRRAWSNYVFTRHHLFRFGQIGGLALLMLLELMVCSDPTDDPAGPVTAPARGLPEAMALLRVLESVEGFPGLGERCLSELATALRACRGAQAPLPEVTP